MQIIEKALKRKGISAAAASEQAVGNNAFIRNIKRGNRPSFDKVEKLFQVLGINLTYSLDDDLPVSTHKVPLLGYISAGGDGEPDDTSLTFIPENDNPDETPSPPVIYARMRGALFSVQVKGSSMLPAYNDGDLLFMYKDDPARSTPERLIGRDCAVTLENGDVYVKRLRRPDSGIDGEWNLESLNPVWPMMTNQRLLEALPVRHVTRKV